jgi:hypothetical protein
MKLDLRLMELTLHHRHLGGDTIEGELGLHHAGILLGWQRCIVVYRSFSQHASSFS